MKRKKLILFSSIILGIIIFEILSTTHVIKLNKIIQEEQTEKMIEELSKQELFEPCYEEWDDFTDKNLYSHTIRNYILEHDLNTDVWSNFSINIVTERLHCSDLGYIDSIDKDRAIGRVALNDNDQYYMQVLASSPRCRIWLWNNNTGFVVITPNDNGVGRFSVKYTGSYFVGFLGNRNDSLQSLSIYKNEIIYPSENLYTTKTGSLTPEENEIGTVLLQKGNKYLFTADNFSENMEISLLNYSGDKKIDIKNNKDVIEAEESGLYTVNGKTNNEKNITIKNPRIIEIEKNTVISTDVNTNLIYNLEETKEFGTDNLRITIDGNKAIHAKSTQNTYDNYAYIPARAYLEANKTYYFSVNTNNTPYGNGDKSVEVYLCDNNNPKLIKTNIRMGKDKYIFKPTKTDIYTVRIDVNSPNTEATFSDMSIKEIKPIQNIDLDEEEVLLQGQTQNLKAVISPSDVSESIKYTSNNTNVVTVQDNGDIKAVGEGEAVITARAEYSGTIATSKIKVLNENNFPSENLIAKSENLTSKTDAKIDYKVETDGNNNETFIVTPKNKAGDSFGYIDRKVYLEEGKNYLFSCDIEDGVKWSIEDEAKCVEAWLIKDGNSSTAESNKKNLIRINNSKYMFTPQATGEYWLRLDVNEPIGDKANSYKFKNIAILRIGDTRPTGIKTELYKNVAKNDSSQQECSIEKEKVESNDIEFNNTENLYEIQAKIEPENSTNGAGKITYTSSDESIVEVNSEGKLNIKKEGTATITASICNGVIKSEVGINVKPSKDITSIDFYTEKDYKYINGRRILMGDVNADGIITANDASLVLQRTLDGGFELAEEEAAKVSDSTNITADCSMLILQKVLDSSYIFPCFLIDSLELGINETKKINTELIPTNACEGEVIWSSSNTSVATVDDNGNVKGLGTGSTTITAKSKKNNSIKKELTVTVGNYKAEPQVNVSTKEGEGKTDITVSSDTTESKNSAYIKSIYVEVKGTTYTEGQIVYGGETEELPNGTKKLEVGSTDEKFYLLENNSSNSTLKEKEVTFDITSQGSYEIATTVTDSNGNSKTDIKNVVRDITNPIVKLQIDGQEAQIEEEEKTYKFDRTGIQIHLEATDNECGLRNLQLIIDKQNDNDNDITNVYEEDLINNNNDKTLKHDYVINEPGTYKIKCDSHDKNKNHVTINTTVVIETNNKADGIYIYTDKEYLTVDGKKYLMGDVNKDGKINDTDAELVLDWVEDTKIDGTFDEIAADVDASGIITSNDVSEIKNKISNNNYIFNALYINSANIKVGEELQLNAIVKPDDASQKEIHWTVEDGNIASITQEGKVKGLKPGITIINVQTKDGSAQTKFNITVLDSVAPEDPTIILNGQTVENKQTYTFNEPNVKVEIKVPNDVGSGVDHLEYILEDKKTGDNIIDYERSSEDVTFTIDEEGSYRLDVVAVDKESNVSKQITVNIIIKNEDDEEYFEVLNYKKDENYILKILPNTTYGSFKQNINTNMDYVVKENNNEINDSTIIKTGQTLIVTSSKTNQTTTYKLIVVGDINRDGKISITDLSNLRKNRLGKMDLDDDQLKASDVNLNGNQDLTDKQIIQKYILEMIDDLNDFIGS